MKYVSKTVYFVLAHRRALGLIIGACLTIAGHEDIAHVIITQSTT
jgi:hypothetical protein